jgi:hypothetical protein
METKIYLHYILLIAIITLFASCSKKDSIVVNKKEYKDSTVAIKKINKKYFNGYVEFEFVNLNTALCKVPENILNEIKKNHNDYTLEFKIIPDTVIAEKEDYYQYIINTKTKEKIPVKNKYNITDEDFEAILSVVLKNEADKNKCFEKVRNKRKIVDVDLFDLNSDGQDEFIVWCVSTDCFIYNHGQDLYIIEKKGNQFITLFTDMTESFEVQNEITNGYFNIEESGIAGRGQRNPDEVITTYKFNGKQYKKSRTSFRKIDLGDDEFDDEYGDGMESGE